MGGPSSTARRVLLYETEGLLHRLDRVRPLITQIPTVAAAAIAPAAAREIDRFLAAGRDELRGLVRHFRRWLLRAGDAMDPTEAQRRFTMVRLRFNRVLGHFETYSDALVQRCEHEYGTLLRGLDVLAEDALATGAAYYEPCPVITYLDRGMGAAIRKARTRLPGGGATPVAIIRVPRERMVGSGIGASLVHEVGHQVAALLGLVPSLRHSLQAMQQAEPADAIPWGVWEGWISEIVADFWSVGLLGIGATIGLMQVVSLPRAFVFKIHLKDPHPAPWIRVHLSCAMGERLYPHPQWRRLAALWDSFYPLDGVPLAQQQMIRRLVDHAPRLASFLIDHRPAACGGKRLKDLVPTAERAPQRLVELNRAWAARPGALEHAAPTLAMAVLGQAKFNGALRADKESSAHARLLRSWAVRRALGEAPAPPSRSEVLLKLVA